MTITDLIYDYKALPIIKDRYPNVKIEDSTDDVHYGRFSVTLEEDVTRWFKFLLKEGMHGISLWCQLAMAKGMPRHQNLIDALHELKKEKSKIALEGK